MSAFMQRRDEEARRQAGEDFAGHVLTVEGEGRYLCKEPGTVINAFRVIFGPRLVLLYGDIGELLLLPNDRDSLAWLRGATKNGSGVHNDYLLSKIPGDFREAAHREFCPELAHEEITEALADDQLTVQQAAALRHAADSDGDAEHEWNEEWSDISSDCEWPRARYYTWRTLYQVEALRWFVVALDAQAAPFPSSPS